VFEKNRILQMLEQNQIPLGMQCFIGDPILIEIMGLTGPKVSAAYKQVLETAKRHNVAVIGGPILSANAQDCKKALKDGIRVFSLGSLGFRTYCQQMVNELDQGVAGTEFTRPPKRDWGFKA
jgi:hypothetical protein